MYVLRYKMPTTILEWTESTYAEQVKVRHGIAFVNKVPARDFLLNSNYEYVPDAEIEAAKALYNS